MTGLRDRLERRRAELVAYQHRNHVHVDCDRTTCDWWTGPAWRRQALDGQLRAKELAR